MDSHKSQDTIAEWSGFLVSASTRPYMFLCLTLKQANDVFFFLILRLFTLHCNFWIWCIRWSSLVSPFHCELHRYLRKQIVWPSSPLLKNPPASRYSPPSPPRVSSWQIPQRPEIFVPFSSSLVAGSLWNNVHACCSFSNKRPSSVLHCNSSWVVLDYYLCNNYPLYWLCTQSYP